MDQQCIVVPEKGWMMKKNGKGVIEQPVLQLGDLPVIEMFAN